MAGSAINETPARFEPAFLEGDVPTRLTDLALAISAESRVLPGRLPPAAAAELADLVRIMNCYYSNLIENHRTRPVDIERAMVDADAGRGRPLVQEARAHVVVQRHIDDAHAAGTLGTPTDAVWIADAHRRFYEAMPDALRTSTHGERTVVIVPGAFRSEPSHDVKVGDHLPPSSTRLGDFMAAFERRFRMARGPTQAILAIPAAHHRLNYIHPFVDGNGRVSRLMSHAMALRAGIGAGGLWSISRGLARGLDDASEYRMHMATADIPRQGSRDGRGNLSERALVDFSEWFLKVALDQVTFCGRAFELDTLSERYKALAGRHFKDERHGKLIAAVLSFGEMERGKAAAVLDVSPRTASDAIAACTKRGYLKSHGPKGKLRVGFPVAERAALFPGLFAEEYELPKRRHREIDT